MYVTRRQGWVLARFYGGEIHFSARNCVGFFFIAAFFSGEVRYNSYKLCISFFRNAGGWETKGYNQSLWNTEILCGIQRLPFRNAEARRCWWLGCRNLLRISFCLQNPVVVILIKNFSWKCDSIPIYTVYDFKLTSFGCFHTIFIAVVICGKNRNRNILDILISDL